MLVSPICAPWGSIACADHLQRRRILKRPKISQKPWVFSWVFYEETRCVIFVQQKHVNSTIKTHLVQSVSKLFQLVETWFACILCTLFMIQYIQLVWS